MKWNSRLLRLFGVLTVALMIFGNVGVYSVSAKDSSDNLFLQEIDASSKKPIPNLVVEISRKADGSGSFGIETDKQGRIHTTIGEGIWWIATNAINLDGSEYIGQMQISVIKGIVTLLDNQSKPIAQSPKVGQYFQIPLILQTLDHPVTTTSGTGLYDSYIDVNPNSPSETVDTAQKAQEALKQDGIIDDISQANCGTEPQALANYYRVEFRIDKYNTGAQMEKVNERVWLCYPVPGAVFKGQEGIDWAAVEVKCRNVVMAGIQPTLPTPTPMVIQTPYIPPATNTPVETPALTSTPAPQATTTLTPSPTVSPSEAPSMTATVPPTVTSTSVSTQTTTPAPSETATETQSPTITPTNTLVSTQAPSPTQSPTDTATTIPASATSTNTFTPTATSTSLPTSTAQPTETETVASSSTPTSTFASNCPQQYPCATETRTVETPSIPTDTATVKPTYTPQPTNSATPFPTLTATNTNTETPISTNTPQLTSTATVAPTASPTDTTEATSTPNPCPKQQECADETRTAVSNPEIPSNAVPGEGDTSATSTPPSTQSSDNRGNTVSADSATEIVSTPTDTPTLTTNPVATTDTSGVISQDNATGTNQANVSGTSNVGQTYSIPAVSTTEGSAANGEDIATEPAAESTLAPVEATTPPEPIPAATEPDSSNSDSSNGAVGGLIGGGKDLPPSSGGGAGSSVSTLWYQTPTAIQYLIGMISCYLMVCALVKIAWWINKKRNRENSRLLQIISKISFT